MMPRFGCLVVLPLLLMLGCGGSVPTTAQDSAVQTDVNPTTDTGYLPDTVTPVDSGVTIPDSGSPLDATTETDVPADVGPVCASDMVLCARACVDLMTSTGNCGTCGHVCPSAQVCSAGVCACPSSGTLCGATCTDTTSDAANCGGCGRICPTAQTCTAGVCACPGGGLLCGETCVAAATDPSNCGSCGLACAAPSGGTATCVAGVCGFVCNPSYSVCAGACVATDTDVANCGSCGNICAVPAQGAANCVVGACGVTCNGGYTTCGGACVATDTDVANCGSCGNACTAPTANGAASCSSGACGFACNAGFVSAGTTCVPLVPPRQIAPLSTATVTSRRPTLHWSLPSGATGAQVPLCRDRALTVGCTSLNVTGGSGAPSADLAAGVWFWDLASRAGTATGTAVSPTWEFSVGALTATAANTSWGTTLDVNGDGYADVVVGAPSDWTAYVYLGGVGGIATSATTLTGPSGSGFGVSVASAGDVNGDGYADVVVGATYLDSAYIYLGGSSGIAMSATTLTGARASYFGSPSASAGDVNGDGYGDLVVGAFLSGTAYVYFGGSGGIAASATTLTGPSRSDFGDSVACAGDVNGDGYADVVVGGGAADTMYVYLGDSGGLGTTPTSLPGPSRSGVGRSVASAGDVNGDGYADVLTGAIGLDAAYFYLGSAGGIATTATMLTGPSGSSDFGYSVAGAGDVNGDGYSDLVVGTQTSGAARVYFGNSGGVTTIPTTLTGPNHSGFGSSVACRSDLDSAARPRAGLVSLPTARFYANHAARTPVGHTDRTGCDSMTTAQRRPPRCRWPCPQA